MKKLFCIVVLCLSFCTLFAKDCVFKLDPVIDGFLLTSGVALELTGMSMEKFVDEKAWDKTPNDKDSVNSFDRAFMHKYNKTLDKTADATFVLLAAGQLALTFTAEKQECIPVLVMAAETVMITDGTKRILKKSTGRFRPYTYYEDAPSDDDYAESWPSGHAMNSFALATFSSYVFSQYYPDSAWKWAVTVGAYSLATFTTCARVYSGCHFTTDILTGAAFGSAIGFLVPFVHKINTSNLAKKSGTTFALSPLGASCKIKL